ncbi:MAG TPA: hypothetical protein VGG74_03015 [Kofleriaceae bacterium]
MTDLRRGVLVLLVCTFGGCSDCNAPQGETYFEENIQPILLQKCATNTSGCHAANVGDPFQFASGNLDVTTFANIQKRRDVLETFGPYPVPLLLIKAVAPETIDDSHTRLQFQYGLDPSDPTGNTPAFHDIEVLHAGGAVLTINSDAYLALQTWMQNGATEDGLAPATPAQKGNGQCSDAIPADFSATTFMANPNYAAGLASFTQNVQPIFNAHGCTSGNCHGAPQSDFYITCGSTPDELAFNFTQAWAFVNTPVADSQILEVPLAVASGGRGHTGGDQFSGTTDSDYEAIQTWAQSVGVLDFANGDPVKQYFQDNVQPILIARGCSFEACHSPMATNDFKLRSGTQGFYSAIALEKNYELAKDDFMAMEFPDARRSRAIMKTILADDSRVTSVGGIAHRGGPVIETPGFSADPLGGNIPPMPVPACTDPTAAATPFCIIQQWVTMERAADPADVSPMNAGDQLPLVYVDRPAGQTASRLEFDTFQPGADLRTIQLQFGTDYGRDYTVNGASTSLLTNCGLTGSIDIGRPDVKNDGDSVAFAARTSASTGWRIYTVSISTKACSMVNTSPPSDAVDDFDPAWSPDGTYLAFASTRGVGSSGIHETRVQPRPQSDIWRMQMPSGAPEPMTVLSNSEINPHFIREGRMVMSTEKASDNFYQVSGRRLNWDLTDYHPLLGQRQDSPYTSGSDADIMDTYPSIGYSQVTDVREEPDGNYDIILSTSQNGISDLHGGAGALAIFNRSVGPFEADRTQPGFLQSVTIIGSPTATGYASATNDRNVAAAVDGYRAPFAMPDGQIMASYASSVQTLAWDLVVVNPTTNVQTSLNIPSTNGAVCDAVLAYKWPARATFANRRQLVFGGSVASDTSHATLYMPDAPMVFTVLTGNLRRGRPVDALRKASQLVVYSEGVCPPGTGTCARTTDGIYQSRSVLGKAPLQSDGSVKVTLPAQTGIVLELQDSGGNSVSLMREEHQLGPGESIAMGVAETVTATDGSQVAMFNAVCGGCHGSVSGSELDIAVSADALTGASSSAAQQMTPVSVGN